MAGECCHNCLYAWWDLGQAMQSFASGFPSRPACANHPDSLGRMRPARLGEICRNYRPRPADPAQHAKRIPVSDGLYAYVDAADYEWLSQWTWHLQDGYAIRWEKGKKIYMHRMIMQPPEGMKVDHASRNRLDNTRDNLRICTHQENMYNRVKRAGSISRFKGVGRRKRDNKWYAELGAGTRPLWRAFFDDEVEAARAYDRAAVEQFGEFANPNFPEEWPPERRKEVHAKWLEEQAREEGKGKKARGRSKKADGKKSSAHTGMRGRGKPKRSTPAAKRKTESARTADHKSPATAPKRRKGSTQSVRRKTREEGKGQE